MCGPWKWGVEEQSPVVLCTQGSSEALGEAGRRAGAVAAGSAGKVQVPCFLSRCTAKGGRSHERPLCVFQHVACLDVPALAWRDRGSSSSLPLPWSSWEGLGAPSRPSGAGGQRRPVAWTIRRVSPGGPC